MSLVEPTFEKNKVYEIFFDENCRVNLPDETIIEQVEHSIRLGLPQAMPYQPNGQTAIIVAGGPSLKMMEKEIARASWADGNKVIALNGAYNWCLEHNIRPAGMVALDARQFGARFVGDPVDGCTYFLASQCHPDVFERCRDRRIMIWHALSCGEPELAVLKKFYFDPNETQPVPSDHYGAPFRAHLYPVTLGCTVALRAMSLLRMLGFMRMEVFGLDSCYLNDRHHAYEQPENDDDGMIRVWLNLEGGRDAKPFYCSPWMVKQAQDFMDLIKDRGDLFSLNVHGPGLIATMIRTGAELEVEK